MGYVDSRAFQANERARADDKDSKEKMHINVVVIGHVDSGKSTTTGRKIVTHPNQHLHHYSHVAQT